MKMWPCVSLMSRKPLLGRIWATSVQTIAKLDAGIPKLAIPTASAAFRGGSEAPDRPGLATEEGQEGCQNRGRQDGAAFDEPS